MGSPSKKAPMNFKGMPQVDVPQGRNGKHKAIVTKIECTGNSTDATAGSSTNCVAAPTD